MRRLRIAELDCVIHGSGDRTVVLLHGFGAPAEDLVPLAWELRPPPDTRFVLPAGPVELGLPFSDARAWWLLDAARLARGEIDPGWVPPGLGAARAMLLAFLDALGAAPDQTVIGGFSPGSSSSRARSSASASGARSCRRGAACPCSRRTATTTRSCPTRSRSGCARC